MTPPSRVLRSTALALTGATPVNCSGAALPAWFICANTFVPAAWSAEVIRRCASASSSEASEICIGPACPSNEIRLCSVITSPTAPPAARRE